MSKEQLAGYEVRLIKVEEQMNSIQKTIVKLESDVMLNNSMTKKIEENTSEIVTILKASKIIGSFAKWLTAVAAAVGLSWSALKGWRF